MTLILSDIDDTVLNYQQPFWDWMLSKGLKPRTEIGEVYDLGIVLGIEADEALDLIEKFTHEDKFEHLSPEPCAAVVLPDLYRRGYRFAAITATVDSEEVREKRLRNLKEAFGFDWEDCHCTGLRKPKTPFLEGYEATVWVEDNFSHAVDGHEIGHTSYLISRGYNRGLSHPGVNRVDDWHDIKEKLNV